MAASGAFRSPIQAPCRRPAHSAAPVPWVPTQGPCVRAKAKGGKGGKAAKGKSSALDSLLAKKKEKEQAEALAKAEEAYKSPEIRSLLLSIANSYWKHTKKTLIETDLETLPDAIFNAPFVVLAHNKHQEGVTDPLFIYGNRAGLDLFEASWDELIGMPSRKSAPADASVQQDRNSLLDNAGSSGVITNYTGVRVSLKGHKFTIKDVTLFNVEDLAGDLIGQAVVFDKYEKGGKEYQVQGYTDPDSVSGTQGVAEGVGALSVPSVEDIEAAQAAVNQWAAYVRTLKEEQGLTNKDPTVQEAVGNLQAWKTQLATLQKRLDDAMAAAKAAFDDEDE